LPAFGTRCTPETRWARPWFRAKAPVPLITFSAEPYDAPAPRHFPAKDRILLGHGSRRQTQRRPAARRLSPGLPQPRAGRLDDQAVLEIGGERLAFTTDSFVVKPLFFRGGDIGSLAVHGTVNDLAMGGAEPLYLSAAFILEEGLSIDLLARIAESMGPAAEAAGIEIVTGDTKVVEKGSGDGVFINTTGHRTRAPRRPALRRQSRAPATW
jgi:hydrogenase expression/formation protein HypE